MIGRGGQGVVLKVRHLEWNQELALKLPLPSILESPVSQERYLREAQTWIQLGLHPHIVRCWFVKPVTGLPGLFLDFVSRGSLETWLQERRKGELQTRSVVRMLLEAAEGLAHSHSLGVVHRDVKPANLLIDAKGRLQVTDFGLVKNSENQIDLPGSSDTGGTFDPGITGSGEFVGTPSYGAPEQWVGGPVGPSADIYALGIVFYELLCGRRPFNEPKTKAELGKLILAHLKTAPPDPREFNSKIPAKLAKLSLQCLAKKPQDRPPSMRALIGALVPIFNQLSSRGYQGPAAVSQGERPDLLNNAAVSLYSLGHAETAGRLLARGLRKEAGHAECLYNLVQIQRRSGVAAGPESLRRLRRANLKYPLAALCVEEGLYQKALEVLGSIPSADWNGMAYRTRGDALMYLRKFPEAAQAYQQAEQRMPGDKPTRVRLQCAHNGITILQGKTLFPSPLPCAQDRVHPGAVLKISHNSLALIGVTQTEVVCLNIDTKQEISTADRPEGSAHPERVYLSPDRILIQDQSHFELWQVPDLKLISRTRGRVLANSPDLQRFLLQRDSELRFVDMLGGVRTKLTWPGDMAPPKELSATFDTQDNLHLLGRDGRLGTVTSNYEVVLEPWRGGSQILNAVIFTVVPQRRELASATQDGLLEYRILEQGKVLYRHRLPFVPTTLCTDASTRRLIATSPTHSAVLNEEGQFLFQSLGPLALNQERTRFMAWEKGRVSLFALRPFRRLRSWAPNVPRPRAMDLALDARRAVTMAADGHYQVWEVDEENRVFERALLLTPGQTYSQLVASYQKFEDSFKEAREMVHRSRFPAAYESLSEARKVSGFHQAEEALALQWVITGQLRRENLEAIWERLTTERVRNSCISSDSRYMAMVQAEGLTIWRNAGSKTSLIRTIKTRRSFLRLHFLDSQNHGTLIAFVDAHGMGECQRLSDGEPVERIDCGSGRLRMVKFLETAFFFLTQDNAIGYYDLEQGVISSLVSKVGARVREIFPIRDHVTMALTDNGPMVLDLRKRRAAAILPPKFQNQITYLSAIPDRNLLLLGLADGTAMVSDELTGNILHQVDLEGGAVSGFQIATGLSLGIAITTRGKLTLWDLSRGRILEQFTAHAAAVVELAISTEGRYLTTIADTGQARLWETSWLLGSKAGPPPVIWLRLGKNAAARRKKRR